MEQLFGRRITLVFFVFLLCQVMFAAEAWAQAVRDTIIPTGDQNVNWFTEGCGTTHYACVDDPLGAPDDWTTYLYRNTANSRETYTGGSVSMSSVDSIVMHIRAVTYTSACTLEVGWDWWEEALWYFYPKAKVSTPLNNFGNLQVMSSTDEYGNAWTSTSVNNRRFGFRCYDATGERYVTQYYVIVYGQQLAGISKTKERRFRNLYETEE